MALGLTPEDQEYVQKLFHGFAEQMKVTLAEMNNAMKPLADWCKEHGPEVQDLAKKMKERNSSDSNADEG
jgi:hypothetical protein